MPIALRRHLRVQLHLLNSRTKWRYFQVIFAGHKAPATIFSAKPAKSAERFAIDIAALPTVIACHRKTDVCLAGAFRSYAIKQQEAKGMSDWRGISARAVVLTVLAAAALLGVSSSAQAEAWRPDHEDFITVSTAASPGVAYALRRDGDRLWAVVDVEPWNLEAPATQVDLGICAARPVMLHGEKAAPQEAPDGQAALGDLRLSIGNFKGKPTAVMYRGGRSFRIEDGAAQLGRPDVRMTPAGQKAGRRDHPQRKQALPGGAPAYFNRSRSCQRPAGTSTLTAIGSMRYWAGRFPFPSPSTCVGTLPVELSRTSRPLAYTTSL